VVAADGTEAIEAFRFAWEDNEPYDRLLVDNMMPNVDRHEAVQTIRCIESEIGVSLENRVPIVMTTALDDPRNVVDAYLVKPKKKDALYEALADVGIHLE
jgi:two-component system chemotaxis response regulator CheY